jgi:hypothetical protein
MSTLKKPMLSLVSALLMSNAAFAEDTEFQNCLSNLSGKYKDAALKLQPTQAEVL